MRSRVGSANALKSWFECWRLVRMNINPHRRILCQPIQSLSSSVPPLLDLTCPGIVRVIGSIELACEPCTTDSRPWPPKIPFGLATIPLRHDGRGFHVVRSEEESGIFFGEYTYLLYPFSFSQICSRMPFVKFYWRPRWLTAFMRPAHHMKPHLDWHI